MFDPDHKPRAGRARQSGRGSLLAGSARSGGPSAPRQSETGSQVGSMLSALNDARRTAAGHRANRDPEPAISEAGVQQVDPRQLHIDAHGDEWAPLIDPRLIIASVMRLKWLVVAFGLAGFGLAALYALSTPKVYYSQAEILVDPREIKISEREITPTGLPYDASLALVENQTLIITSRRVMERVVDSLSLDKDPEFNGTGTGGIAGPLTLVGELLGGKGAADSGKRRELAIRKLYSSVHVGRTPKSFIIVIGATTQVPDKSARIANEIASVYIDLQKTLRSETVDRTGRQLEEKLADLRAKVEQADRDVELFKSQNDIIDVSGKRIADEDVLRISTQLGDARRRIIDLKARVESVRSMSADAIVAGALPEEAGSTLLAQLRTAYATKRQERDSLSEKLGPRHPKLLDVSAELASMAREIVAEQRRIIQALQVELQRAVRSEQDLSAELARLKANRSELTPELVELRELERSAAAARSIYESFLLRARDTAEQGGIDTANTTIISNAAPALQSTGASRKTVALAGLVAGLLAGISIGVLRGIWWSISVPPESLRPGAFMRPARQVQPTPDPSERVVHAKARTRLRQQHDDHEDEVAARASAPMEPAPIQTPPPAPHWWPQQAAMPVMAPPMPVMAPAAGWAMPNPAMMMHPAMMQPMQAPSYWTPQPQPVQQPVAEPPRTSAQPAPDYSAVRERMSRLKEGISAFAEKRQKLASLN